MILVIGVAVWIAVLVDGDQLSCFQRLDGVLQGSLLDAGVPDDSVKGGPAVAFATGAANEIRIESELDGSHRDGEDVIR